MGSRGGSGGAPAGRPLRSSGASTRAMAVPPAARRTLRKVRVPRCSPTALYGAGLLRVGGYADLGPDRRRALIAQPAFELVGETFIGRCFHGH